MPPTETGSLASTFTKTRSPTGETVLYCESIENTVVSTLAHVCVNQRPDVAAWSVLEDRVRRPRRRPWWQGVADLRRNGGDCLYGQSGGTPPGVCSPALSERSRAVACVEKRQVHLRATFNVTRSDSRPSTRREGKGLAPGLERVVTALHVPSPAQRLRRRREIAMYDARPLDRLPCKGLPPILLHTALDCKPSIGSLSTRPETDIRAEIPTGSRPPELPALLHFGPSR